MKKFSLTLITATILLSACATSAPERIVTKGPLICSEHEVCPELSIRWIEEKRNGFKITAEINNAEAYNIKQLEFIIDGQPYTYSTIQPTKFKDVSGLKNSTNFIQVPVSFLNSFTHAKQIDLKLVTDKGDIERPILKANGEKSSAYLTFLKGYKQ
ncbi:hypothetical protein [Acinetobacter shaoyimingii]|uniref:Lipoprotein n=1 Tax=Acinetobacter shaoyimingii TaxID=2715164 RepID=A0A6G8RVQ8_9GAMM|nr:hypothetical protein [Acinetobacter shaoyimingii]NHB57437.1 hypothetical protein [Acinetobacter shaoyimingii]QIO05967.1 hypothetical protein G8E00_08395 [Acinetobacter shaoyimingii]